MTSAGEPSRSRQLLASVRDCLQAQIERGATVVVGVSGGADSTCLLYATHQVARELGIRLHVAHLNHQLRGEESEGDQQFVVDLAARLGVPITVAREDVRGYQRRTHRSLEDAARHLRHCFLAEVVRETGASAVLLAHTADDQAETILLRLVRGTGPRGLSGMRVRSTIRVADCPHDQPPTDLVIVRPLLSTYRAEILEYLAAAEIPYREDSTNRQPIALRNRIRQRVLPLLEKENPRVREAIVRLAESQAIENDFFDLQVERLWPVATEWDGDELLLLSRELLAAPRAVRRRLLLRALERAEGAPGGTSATLEAVERLEQALSSPAGPELHLPGVRAVVEYQRVRLHRTDAEPPAKPKIDSEVPLEIPGETVIGDWCFRADVRPAAEALPNTPDRWTAYLDLDKLGGRAAIRTRRPGDRFVPTGMTQLKKLQDYFVDEHIPQRQRDQVPLVVGPEGIAWVVGHRQDARFMPTEQTRRVLVLTFAPVEEC